MFPVFVLAITHRLWKILTLTLGLFGIFRFIVLLFKRKRVHRRGPSRKRGPNSVTRTRLARVPPRPHSSSSGWRYVVSRLGVLQAIPEIQQRLGQSSCRRDFFRVQRRIRRSADDRRHVGYGHRLILRRSRRNAAQPGWVRNPYSCLIGPRSLANQPIDRSVEATTESAAKRPRSSGRSREDRPRRVNWHNSPPNVGERGSGCHPCLRGSVLLRFGSQSPLLPRRPPFHESWRI